MIDTRDIPLHADQLRYRVQVYAIMDQANQQYEQITKGYVELCTDNDQNNQTIYSLEVKDEKTNQLLMRSNLNIQKNFGRQKNTIISWTDQQQPQYSEIAISFEKQNQCDQFWRTICEKIGKSYLEICGTDKLQIPNNDNLTQFLEKAKNNIDLVDYNIVHSKTILEALYKIFKDMKSDNNYMGMGVIYRILNTILSSAYSLNCIQKLLTGQNFLMLLEVQEYKRNIKFREIYDKKIGNYLKNRFNLPQQIFQKVQLSHRAVFYRQNVLQLSQQSRLQSFMFTISKEAIIQIIAYLNRTKFIQKIINKKQNNNLKQKIQQNNCSNTIDLSNESSEDQITFILQSLNMYQQISSQHIRMNFRQNLFNGNIINFIKQKIQQNNIKALQILFYISQIDRIKFIQYLIQNFKSNSTDNLLKTLMKKYISQQNMRNSIICLIQSMIVIFNQKKQCLEFFNGTFLYSIFSVAKDVKCILMLINTLMATLQNCSTIFIQLIKLKIFQKLATQYRNGTGLQHKIQELNLLKLFKYIIIQQSNKKQLKNKQIQKNLIQSGFFDCCMMIYLKYSQKYNILSSSMLQNLKLIQKMQYSQFDQYLIKQYSQNQVLQKILKPIKQKHIEYINHKKQNQKQQKYIQVQRINHQTILENQQQDSYLMDQQNEAIINHNHDMNVKINQDKNTQGDKEEKQNQLQCLKRMMYEVAEEKQKEQINGPRKIVKKNQDMKQTVIQFSFDLPDMNELRAGQDT